MSKKKENYNELAVEFQNTKTHSSFTRLYHKMRPGLKYYIRNFVKDGDVTEDLLARTFEKIYRKIDTYKPEYSITTWAYSIARRECIRWIKRERNKKVSLSYFQENGGEVVDNGGQNKISLGSMVMDPEEFITENDAWKDEGEEITKYDLTVKAINSLKPMYREILVDNLFNGLKYKEIAYKIEPGLGALVDRYEAGEMTKPQAKKYEKYYKTILQRVKNRVRRGKMLVEADVKAQMSKMDI
jgi:RNA polymerase sigma-70 factor (ECF subfamily)